MNIHYKVEEHPVLKVLVCLDAFIGGPIFVLDTPYSIFESGCINPLVSIFFTWHRKQFFKQRPQIFVNQLAGYIQLRNPWRLDILIRVGVIGR